MFSAKARVLVANEVFYEAMRDGDLAAMDGLWSDRMRVACTHPGRTMLQSRQAIMESWRMIFEGGGGVAIRADQCLPIVTGRTAMVVCEEHLSDVVLMASNVFVEENGRWRMTSHQAAEMPLPASDPHR